MDSLVQVMFKKANSGSPTPPTQTRAQRQQQLQYPVSTTSCSIHFHDNNKIRLINAPSSLVPSLRRAIASTWSQPIQGESRLDYSGGGEGGVYEFKLGGKPWAPSPKTGPFIASTNLVLAMKRAMETKGWSLVLASNGLEAGSRLSSTQSRERDPDEMTLVGEFEQKDKYDYKNGDQRQEQEQELSEAGSVNMLNIEFSGYDTIRVSEAPTVIITALRLAILKYWTQGIEKEGDKKGIREYTLTGCPFQTWGAETTIEVSMVFIQALENMRLHGFKLVGSTDLDVIGKTERQETKEKKEKKVKENLIIDSWVLRRMQQ